MVKKLKSKALDELLQEISSTPEVIEFRKIEALVLENEEIKAKLDRLHEVEKQAVNAKEFGLENAYFAYMKEYKEILNSFENDVLISQYIALKEDAKDILDTVINVIEKEIFKAINE